MRPLYTKMSRMVKNKHENGKRNYDYNFPLKSYVTIGAFAKKILKKIFGYFYHLFSTYVASREPLKIICWKFILGSFTKTCKQLHFELKFDKIKGILH
jgi:hypothetical protein